MCCQHVNRLDAALADSVTHAPSVLTQAYAFLLNLTDGCIKAQRRWWLDRIQELYSPKPCNTDKDTARFSGLYPKTHTVCSIPRNISVNWIKNSAQQVFFFLLCDLELCASFGESFLLQRHPVSPECTLTSKHLCCELVDC